MAYRRTPSPTSSDKDDVHNTPRQSPIGGLMGNVFGAFGAAGRRQSSSALPKSNDDPVNHIFDDPSSSTSYTRSPEGIAVGPNRGRILRGYAARRGTVTKRQNRELAAQQSAQRAADEEALRLEEQAERDSGFLSPILEVLNQSPGYTLGDFLTYFFTPSKLPNRAIETVASGSTIKPHISLPTISNELRWQHFHSGTYLKDLMRLWDAPGVPQVTSRVLDELAIERVCRMVRKEAKEITESEILWSRNREINEELILGFNLNSLHDDFRDKLAPTSMKILKHIATSARQESEGLSKPMEARKRNVCTTSYLSLLGEYSQSNSRPRQMMGIYLYTTGAQRQTINVLHNYGVCCAYSTLMGKKRGMEGPMEDVEEKDGGQREADRDEIRTDMRPLGECQRDDQNPPNMTTPNETPSTLPHPKTASSTTINNANGDASAQTTSEAAEATAPPFSLSDTILRGVLPRLSEMCRRKTRQIAQSLAHIKVYDNINAVNKVAEQTVGRKDAQENGTCATIVELHNPNDEALSASSYADAFDKAPDLQANDIFLTPEQREEYHYYLVYTIMRIAVQYGGTHLEKWKERVAASQPKSKHKISTHKSKIHPLPAFEIDESSITGNADVIDAICAEVGIDPNSPEFKRKLQLVAGDQLSIARLRSIIKNRAGQEGGYGSYAWLLCIPGLFHLKMAATQGVLETFWGKPNTAARNPSSLWYHNSLLDRKHIVLTSPPPFRTTRDLIFDSLTARVLHCLLKILGRALGSGLDGFASVTTFDELEAAARGVLDKYVLTEDVATLRQARKEGPEGQGDMVYENAVLFNRDALFLREFSDAVKSGDSGRIVLSIKVMAVSFRANGRTKYAHELLFLVHNLTSVWPEKLRDLILDNWLVNPTGRDNAFVELDLMQEHLNFWIKTIYLAHGSNASWEWLHMISPCISILRQLATQVHSHLGSYQGITHHRPDISRDIALLMNSLDQEQVYEIQPGRTLDDDDLPAVDTMTDGASALLHGGETNPITQFNIAFNRLRERYQVKPLVGGPRWGGTPSVSGLGASKSTATGSNQATSAPREEMKEPAHHIQDEYDNSSSEEEAELAQGERSGTGDAELGLDDIGDVALESDDDEMMNYDDNDYF